MPTLCSGSSPSPTRQRAGPARKTISLHEILKSAHLKFTVYGRKQTDLHTTSTNAVMLVWGSLRLSPINYTQIVTTSTVKKLLM